MQLKAWVIPTGIGVLSFGVGASVGYFLAKRKFSNKVDEAKLKVEELESEQLQLDFKRVEMDREFNSQIQQSIVVIRELKESAETFKRAGKLIFLPNFSKKKQDDEIDKSVESHPSNETRRITIAPANTEEENIVINVFPDEDDDWDYDEELKTRSPDHPYIIHRDEYFSNEMDFNQNTLMYYEGDNILCDDKDVPIYNPEKIVGKLIFGHGSRDPSICYVRNEQLRAEFEVLIDHGFYTTEVLGTSPDPSVSELKHARPHRVPKFRPE